MENRVYELRKKQGVTLLQLAEKAKVSKTAINNFERGETCPTAETLTRLAEALGVSIDKLLGRKAKKDTSIYPRMEKEEYIKEMQKTLSGIETYKVRYFYIFIMTKLGMMPHVEGGAAHE